MTEPVFSIVCVYNDEKILNGWLLKGLKSQDSAAELILVDNTGGKFKSAAEALNYGGAKAAGEYIIFAHQDLLLEEADWLRRAEAYLRPLPDLGIAGVAGMLPTPSLGLWKVGTAPVENRLGLVASGPAKTRFLCGTVVSAPTLVQTLDEQLLIIPAAVFARVKFDAAACGDWHLYGTDFALSAGNLGLRVYVLPLPGYHRSQGVMSGPYFTTLKKLLKKHYASRSIFTTCGSWHTNLFVNYISLVLMAARAEAGRLLGRNTTGGGLSLGRLLLLLRS